ncbi:MAG: hypothetical protein FWG66_05345 [Spirochaetes bacterium]|nr:hypothetical protein [Spirochaetota bacterium]
MPERKIYTVLNKNVAHSHLIKLFMEHSGVKYGQKVCRLAGLRSLISTA